VKPLLKWAGGKTWATPLIRPLYDPSKRFVELFCGSAALAHQLEPERVLLNDWNADLMNLYRQVQQGLTQTVLFAHDEATYYQHRQRFNKLRQEPEGVDTPEAAQLFYYLNRTCFNGLTRYGPNGFNTPVGRPLGRAAYVDSFEPYTELYKTWQLQRGDFQLAQLEPNDFVYADPPYDESFTEYNHQGFSWTDQVRLATWLAQHPGPVVLANKLTPRVKQMYEYLGFAITVTKAPRRISCKGDREPVAEIIATRNLAIDVQQPA
jgi:DNA adenine methylase